MKKYLYTNRDGQKVYAIDHRQAIENLKGWLFIAALIAAGFLAGWGDF